MAIDLSDSIGAELQASLDQHVPPAVVPRATTPKRGAEPYANHFAHTGQTHQPSPSTPGSESASTTSPSQPSLVPSDTPAVAESAELASDHQVPMAPSTTAMRQGATDGASSGLQQGITNLADQALPPLTTLSQAATEPELFAERPDASITAADGVSGTRLALSDGAMIERVLWIFEQVAEIKAQIYKSWGPKVTADGSRVFINNGETTF